MTRDYMRLAIEEALSASRKAEVPVGCIIERDGRIIARGHNIKEQEFDPCGHAEIVCLRAAGKKIQNWRLLRCVLYVTLEPCSMCLSAMIQARIHGLYFGSYDRGKENSIEWEKIDFNVEGGVEEMECSALLSEFFKKRRNQ